MAINLLDQNTINKIAAGEVVDRPSSVVKELVENAIDAKATAITVEIKDGGISFIRITDNGCGIEENDIKIAFKRHATSKIKSAADLINISSLGFRGEALSSISAVAAVELITKTKDNLYGIRYEMAGGEEKAYEQVGAPDGTTFVVRNLFYNTPARRKFLKTAATEGGYINSVMEHLCMSHPEISFRFINNNQPKLQTSGNGNLKDVIYTIYGREIANNLVEINAKYQNFTLGGYIAKPVVSRGNRNYENYYINGRYVKSKIVSGAIEDAYSNFIMQHNYPFTALTIDIDADLLDVNVHPSKMELRFSNGPYLYDSIRDTVKEALSRRELIPDVKLDNKPTFTPPVRNSQVSTPPLYSTPAAKLINEPMLAKKVPEKPVIDKPVIPARLPEPFETKRAAEYKEAIKTPVYEQLEIFDNNTLLKESNKDKIKIVGQVFDTYWIMEFENNMYIVDQHAAHEKVLFERYMRNFNKNKISTQYISPPVIFTVTGAEEELLNKNMSVFTDMGYEIEAFGGDEYSIRGIPAQFSKSDPKALLIEILDDLSGDIKRATPESIKNAIATMSCKAAVKGNNRLSYDEMTNLLTELMELDNPYNCPHGRPTMISMSKYELEKKFKRII